MKHTEDEYYSSIPRTMILVLLISALLCTVCSIMYMRTKADGMLSFAITFGVIAYHILIRFLSPIILNLIFHKNYNYKAWWFQPRSWEQHFYQVIKIKDWKRKAPMYDPREFSFKIHSLEEIVINMCHAELVHELIVVLSFTSLLFAIPFGSFLVFFITAVIAAMFDMVFVILQRYNRPRVIVLMEKRKKTKAL